MESSASAGRVASAVLVLHDLFGMTFTDVAATVGRTPAAVRPLAARARAHIEEAARRPIVGSRSPASRTRSGQT